LEIMVIIFFSIHLFMGLAPYICENQSSVGYRNMQKKANYSKR
jgi:hypothetical protein